MAADPVRQKVAVTVIPGTTQAVLAAQAATTTISIVFSIGGERVVSGLSAASIAQMATSPDSHYERSTRGGAALAAAWFSAWEGALRPKPSRSSARGPNSATARSSSASSFADATLVAIHRDFIAPFPRFPGARVGQKWLTVRCYVPVVRGAASNLHLIP
jgi:hypothetical protein